MKVVLHACCGPCASACEPRLKEEGHEVVLFFSNCNIDTREEFEKRLAQARKLGAADGVEVVADTYDHADWLEKVAKGFEQEPEKGARCARCFRYSLARTAAWAAAHGYEAFTTSLTVSPHKVSPVVFAAGREAAAMGTDPSAAAMGTDPAAAEMGTDPAANEGRMGTDPAFLEVDFKKKDGFLRSLKRSSELGLYRQAYCGCEFSRRTSS
ncbi:MAG: epoxyqueuosine reductase QueH [Kiritimatiellae bacterium]|nr:epoxyqueuosine reductase QueH [Kiritimatiellia bacterium]